MNKDEILLNLKRYRDQNNDRSSTNQSDVDIVVELERQDLFDLIGIKQDLEEEFDCPVDIISYRKKMNPFLKQRIDDEAIYV